MNMIKKISTAAAIAAMLTTTMASPAFCADNVMALQKGQKLTSEGNPEADSEVAKDYLVVTDQDSKCSVAIKKGATLTIAKDGSYKVIGSFTEEK